ncbi:hypothetical protein [Ensifer canadensis]|uniref:hypothetical protein n=1 Tax=Ensifer canadensis TaxID=555315 RepID=UPI0035E3D665
MLGPLIKRLETEAPQITLHLVPRSRDTEKMLHDDLVDVVVEPSELLPDSDFPPEPLLSDRWLCAADAGTRQLGARARFRWMHSFARRTLRTASAPTGDQTWPISIWRERASAVQRRA